MEEFRWKNLNGRQYLDNIHEDGRITLKQILNKWA
jgi:hypothetical protein